MKNINSKNIENAKPNRKIRNEENIERKCQKEDFTVKKSVE